MLPRLICHDCQIFYMSIHLVIHYFIKKVDGSFSFKLVSCKILENTLYSIYLKFSGKCLWKTLLKVTTVKQMWDFTHDHDFDLIK